MVKGLTEEGEIDRTVFDRRRLDVSKSVFQISQTVFGGSFCPKRYHFLRVVDGDHLLCSLRKKLRERVGHDVIDAKRYLGYLFVG